jgi:hypothetical protein
MLSPFFRLTSPPGLSQLNVSLLGWSWLKTFVVVMKSSLLLRSQPISSVVPWRIELFYPQNFDWTKVDEINSADNNSVISKSDLDVSAVDDSHHYYTKENVITAK